MDWFAYLSLAKELAEHEEGLPHHDKAARQRSAISWAYYAIFCTARDMFDPEHSYYPSQEGSYHARFWKRLKKDPEREEYRYIGENGRRLGEARRKADFEGLTFSLPERFGRALGEAARRLEPTAVRVKPRGASLKTEADVDEYLDDLRARIMHHVSEGRPVVL